MGDMSISSMDNLKGSPLALSNGNTTYMLATRDLARKGFPWCVTAVQTSYFLRPIIKIVNTSATYIDYEFKMDEDFGMCKDVLTRKGKAADVAKQCSNPFYSFIIAVSTECHEAVMQVNTVQMFSKQDLVRTDPYVRHLRTTLVTLHSTFIK